MKFTCPNCRQPLLPESINVQTDLALCKACGWTSRVSTLVGVDAETEVLQHPPPGAWYSETESEVVFGATTRSPKAFVLVPFTIGWVAITMGIAYGTQFADGKFSLGRSLIGLPFLLAGLLLVFLTLLSIGGREEVSMRDGVGTVFVGIARFGRRRSLNLAGTESIELGGRNLGGAILLRPQFIVLGGTLTKPRRDFIFEVLKLLKARLDRKQTASPDAP